MTEAALDRLTQGAFSATTSGDRASKIRDWLATDPDVNLVQEVFKELASKDKGAAKPLRERLDEIKRQKLQESIGEEWRVKANALLQQDKLNIADAMAWQRDAAKAGAGLSREPLLSLKQELAARVSQIEDLQKGCQIQREAAVLLTQRTEVLSTKALRDASDAQDALQKDFANWQDQAKALTHNPHWASVDAKFPPLLESSGQQLQAVWDAFTAALAIAQAALTNPSAPLPNVPVWADEIRQAHGLAEANSRPAKPKLDPAVKAEASARVGEALKTLEDELAQGHGKATVQASAVLRQRLKEFAGAIDHKLEAQSQAALSAAGELEGWQRWRADQLRHELVEKAQALLNRPAGQSLGGKKIQEQLRTLREQWKTTDQGGPTNHALWKKFDEACNEAHKVVDQWIEKVKADNVAHRQARLDLIEELKQWALAHAQGPDWKEVNRGLHHFAQRWQDGGRVNEKTFAEVQPLWKEAFESAAKPIHDLQAASVELRKQMTAEADALGAQPLLDINAVKALQKRWQAEASQVPLERKFEQKLWDRFRKPLDDAFNRKSEEREKAQMALGAYDKAVAEAAAALQQATQTGDAAAIQKAMHTLREVMNGAPPAVAPSSVNPAHPSQTTAPVVAESVPDTLATSAPDAASGDTPDASKSAPKPPPKPVIAMRGDDRPGAKRQAAIPAPPPRNNRFGDKKDAPFARSKDAPFARSSERDPVGARPPRLGDTAFRAQRNALDAADMALKKLAAQAHGEVVTQILAAWQARDSTKIPAAQALGNKVNASVRQSWLKALSSPPQDGPKADTAQLRLEMATETPTPATHMDARRALQLQLLTRRNDPAPLETWGADVAQVLQASYNETASQRLQTVLKVALRGR